jgi:type IV pilus assembly protein PilV
MNASITRQRGATLIEILVTILIVAFGILGLIGLSLKVQVAQADSYQRAQAILLVQDMANRISASRVNAASYVTGTTLLGTPDSYTSCDSLTGVNLDKCEWSMQLKGAAERINKDADCSASNCIGAMVNAVGCVSQISTTPPVYQVQVSWLGSTDLGTPSLSCGAGTTALYPRETLRRTIAANVPVANLSGL